MNVKEKPLGKHHNLIAIGMSIFMTATAIFYMVVIESCYGSIPMTDWFRFFLSIPSLLLIIGALVILAKELR